MTRRVGSLVGLDDLIVNSDLLANMSETDGAASQKEWTAMHEEHTKLWTAATEENIASAKAGGATFSEVDEAAFIKVIEPIAEKFIENDSQQALYDAARTPLWSGGARSPPSCCRFLGETADWRLVVKHG